MLISVLHTTRYSYGTEAGYAIQSLRLTPSEFAGQRVREWSVSVPGATLEACSRDGFGNTVHLATINGAHREIEICAKGRVEVEDRSGVVLGLRDPCPPRVYLRRTVRTESSPELEELAASVGVGSALERLHALSDSVQERVEYEVGATHAHTSAAEALADGRGVCQDHAHVFIACARHLSIPARYVTGYLVTGGEGCSEAHHAWVEAWVDDLGWVAFDVANGLCPTERYVRLACGLDAEYAAPVRGARRGGDAEELDVQVLVESGSAQQ